MKVRPLFDAIEAVILKTYDLRHSERGVDYLINADSLIEQGIDVPTSPAALIIKQKPTEIFMGIYLSDFLSLHQDNQTQTMMILIEELSHFHYTIDRLQKAQQLSKLELELQAEIDKVIIGAQLLQHSEQRISVASLIQHFTDQTKIIDHADAELYGESTRLAMRFWKQFSFMIHDWRLPTDNPNHLQLLRRFYVCDFHQKRQMIEHSVQSAS